jgi:hypothetical protein
MGREILQGARRITGFSGLLDRCMWRWWIYGRRHITLFFSLSFLFSFLSFIPPPCSLDAFHFDIVCSLSHDAWVKTNQSNIRHQAVECAGSSRDTRNGSELSSVAVKSLKSAQCWDVFVFTRAFFFCIAVVHYIPCLCATCLMCFIPLISLAKGWRVTAMHFTYCTELLTTEMFLTTQVQGFPFNANLQAEIYTFPVYTSIFPLEDGRTTETCSE